MPEPAEQLGGAVEYSDTIKISWHFEANLSEIPLEGITFAASGRVPLPGSWKFSIKDCIGGSDKLCVEVHHECLPVGAFGRSVVVKLLFARVLGTDKRLLQESPWKDESEPSFDPETSRSYDTYVLYLSRNKLAAKGCWPASEQNSLQQCCATLVFERDLRLDTARSHSTPTADVEKA